MIDDIEPCRKKADVVFVIDSTLNLKLSDFEDYFIGSIIEIIRRLDVDSGRIRVAAVQFTHEAKVRFSSSSIERKRKRK